MFELTDKDFVPLEDYIFAWRWTDPKRVVIPTVDLRKIKPLSEARAREAMDYSNAFQGKNYWEKFCEEDQLEIDGRGNTQSDEIVKNWLDSCLPSETENLIVSWSVKQAVQTDRPTFVNFGIPSVTLWRM